MLKEERADHVEGAQRTQRSGRGLAVQEERPCARKGTANTAGEEATGLPGGPGAPLLRHLDRGAAAAELRAGRESSPRGPGELSAPALSPAAPAEVSL